MDKNNIIEAYSKNEFARFLENDTTGRILELLDDEGMNILRNSPKKEERMNYIFTYSKYKNELLSQDSFIDLLITSDIQSFYATLRSINPTACAKIIKRCFEKEASEDIIVTLLLYFPSEYQLQFFDLPNISNEIIYKVLNSIDNPIVINKIISKYNIDLTNEEIKLNKFFRYSKEVALRVMEKRNLGEMPLTEIEISPKMINRKLGARIWQEYDIFAARALVNDIEYCTDAKPINDYLKSREDYNINASSEESLIEPAITIYNLFLEYMEARKQCEKENTDELYKTYLIKRNLFQVLLVREFGNENIHEMLNDNKVLLEKLEYLNNKALSNYIIDYHFEENYHNIMLDIKELLHFYDEGNITLPEERVELYREISNIDNLSITEKKELHNKLKELNMKEIFYDDMAAARYIVREAIKNYSLSSQSIKKYKDEKLSKEYGVDVYLMNGQSFFGIIKTGTHNEDTLPTGHSYSLIGDGGLATFGDIKDSATFLYDSTDLNPDQIVHVYPFDSFTMYKPFGVVDESSNKVNVLAMPDEVVSSLLSYNEILILERGNSNTDIDNKILKLKKVALYCLDEIRAQDVEMAKRNNTGIFLVNSKKYNHEKHASLYKYRNSIDDWNYNYFNGTYEKDKFEAGR